MHNLCEKHICAFVEPLDESASCSPVEIARAAEAAVRNMIALRLPNTPSSWYVAIISPPRPVDFELSVTIHIADEINFIADLSDAVATEAVAMMAEAAEWLEEVHEQAQY